MERRRTIRILGLLALLVVAVATGCAAETAQDPSPGDEARLNPQPLPPASGDTEGEDKSAGGDVPSSASTSGASGNSSSSGGASGSSGSSGSGPPSIDGGKE